MKKQNYYRNESHDPRFGKTSPKTSIFKDMSARINNKEPKHMTTRPLKEEFGWSPVATTFCIISIIMVLVVVYACK